MSSLPADAPALPCRRVLGVWLAGGGGGECDAPGGDLRCCRRCSWCCLLHPCAGCHRPFFLLAAPSCCEAPTHRLALPCIALPCLTFLALPWLDLPVPAEVVTGPIRLLFPRIPGSIGEAADFPFSLLGALRCAVLRCADWPALCCRSLLSCLGLGSWHGAALRRGGGRGARGGASAGLSCTWWWCRWSVGRQRFGRQIVTHTHTHTVTLTYTHGRSPRCPPISGLGDIAIPGLLACLALRYDASRAVDLRARGFAVANALQDALSSVDVRGGRPMRATHAAAGAWNVRGLAQRRVAPRCAVLRCAACMLRCVDAVPRQSPAASPECSRLLRLRREPSDDACLLLLGYLARWLSCVLGRCRRRPRGGRWGRWR